MIPIPEFDSYFVNEQGEIFSSKRVPLIKIKQKINKGYAYVYLCKNSKHTTLKVHRIVAQAFIANPENKPEVNHKDGNKLNNHVDNLEWCTRSENNKHAWTTGLKVGTDRMRETARNNGRNMVSGVHGKKVIDTTTGKIYPNITFAAASLNIKQGSLSRKLNGTRKNNTGYQFI